VIKLKIVSLLEIVISVIRLSVIKLVDCIVDGYSVLHAVQIRELPLGDLSIALRCYHLPILYQVIC
jgi:hypothetical protein